jgi:hypothetical protein
VLAAVEYLTAGANDQTIFLPSVYMETRGNELSD